ncbi:MAG: nitroreductase family protein [Actinomycetota bacterium]|nr:nitroreductase family protein [Actinomycetota bacterium]
MPPQVINLSPDPAWYDAIARRTSRRSYDSMPVDSAVLDRLAAAGSRFATSPLRARCEIVSAASESVFKGLFGSYGAVSGAPSFVAFIGPKNAQVDSGYLGEAVILEATLAGLGTCWVAGMFDAAKVAEHIALAPDERVHSVTPLGYATTRMRGAEWAMHTLVRASTRKPLAVIAAGSDGWPQWAQAAAGAVRPAPSGGNGQPWRLRMNGDSLVIAQAPKAYWTAPIDCGIAMLHAELGALHVGVRGSWELLEAPDVARFTPLA